MACCYIAAAVIAFVIRGCDTLDINLRLQYNEPSNYHDDDPGEDLPSGLGNTDLDDSCLSSSFTALSISGMTCASCTSSLQSALEKVEGVHNALVSLYFQEARILHSEHTELTSITDAIENAGFSATFGGRGDTQKVRILQHVEELGTLRKSLAGLSAYSFIIFALGTFVDYVDLALGLPDSVMRMGRATALVLFTIVAIFQHGNWIFHKAASAARNHRANMHTLIVTSTVVGMLLNVLALLDPSADTQNLHLDSIMGVILIVTLGHYLDLLSRRKATATFAGLYSLLNQTANVELSTLRKRVPVSSVRPGDEITINSFDIIPCDCYIVEGRSYVNESVITGESHPVAKEPGDLLLAGSRNGAARLHARVNQDFRGSFLSQLMQKVEHSLNLKVSVQHHIDVIIQYFVVAIFAIATPAAIHAFFRNMSMTSNYLEATNTAGKKLMTILAAACPCALGLATPCAVMASTDACWRKGILLLDGGATMERLRCITHVVMDKTGTLTHGTLTVSDVHIEGAWKEHKKELATLIAAAEEYCIATHPYATAIFRKFLPISDNAWIIYKDSGTLKDEFKPDVRGVKCEVDPGDGFWRNICVGNRAWMIENNIQGLGQVPFDTRVRGSVVFVGVNGDIAGSMLLQDVVRFDARSTIDALKLRGLQVSILTGDQPSEAKRIGQSLCIPVTASAATPEAKVRYIEAIQKNGGKVLMIGDGMNDAPSLARADVGVMMLNGRKCLTAGGSVLLLHARLESIVTLIDISKVTMRHISKNVIWAFIYNAVAIALAIGVATPFGISISPPIAAAMMSASSLLITIQALRLGATLKEDKPSKKPT